MTKEPNVTVSRPTIWSDDMSQIAMRHGTDKWGIHFYTPIYHKLFEPIRNETLNILEIGVGGYEYRHHGGLSLRLWSDYFKNARIIGMDISEKTLELPERTTLVQGNQYNKSDLERVAATHGPFDIIIDDGSHVSKHIIFSFENLFPHLKDGGIYIVEDTQTAYLPVYGGGPFQDPLKTTNGFFKDLTDHINHREISNRYPEFNPHKFASSIDEIRFFHNLIAVKKGWNNAPSNLGNLNGEAIFDDVEQQLERHSALNLV